MTYFFREQEFDQDFFSSRPQYGILGTRISGSNRFVRAPSSGGGSNAPRPALSVLHLDVNADRRWARQARSCKNVVFWGGDLEASVVSWHLQRLQSVMISKNGIIFQTVVAKVLNFAVVYSRAFVLLDWRLQGLSVCFAWRLQGLNEWNTGKLWRMQSKKIRKAARRTRCVHKNACYTSSRSL